MGIGVSILLIAAGAVMTFALNVRRGASDPGSMVGGARWFRFNTTARN